MQHLPFDITRQNWQENVSTSVNGVARTLERLRTSKGDYWIKQ